MATTRLTVTTFVQEMLGDTNPAARVISGFRVNECVSHNTHLMAGRCRMARNSVASLSLVASTYDYAVSATLTHQNIAQVFLNSTGRELMFVPFEEFNAYYQQDTAQPLGSGTPEEYTLYEAITATVHVSRIRFGPTPSAADTAKIHASNMPALLETDATTVPFSDQLVRGLVAACAAELVLAMSPENLAALKLDKAVASQWLADAERAIHDHNVRELNLGHQQDHVLRYGGRRRTGRATV